MGIGDDIVAWAATGEGEGFAWLDGGQAERGFVAAWPDLEVIGDDLELLAGVEACWRTQPESLWIGWMTYDLGVDSALERPVRCLPLPGMVWRRYPGALEVQGDGWVEHGDPAACRRLVDALRRAPPLSGGEWPLGPLAAQLPAPVYRDRVRAAKAHIVAGETYQVNVSQPFAAAWRPETAQRSLAWRASRVFGCLRADAPAVMGALIDAGSAWFVSNSPETLLAVELGAGPHGEDKARSFPIKGTRPRGHSESDDRHRAEELQASAKDLAEHVMIVDLVRNDLGRVAVPGSVRAPAQPDLVTLPTVHHLVSEVSCTLRRDWTLLELVRVLFPGGSITGAPKRRTMAIIDTLEARPRGIYCGAIGVLTPSGLRLSIPIRTGVLDRAGLALQSGGGIVADSDPEAERLETLVKTKAFDRA